MRALVLLALLALVSCNRSPKFGESHKVIGVIPKGASHIFWQTVHAGAVKAARDAGYTIEWNSPTLEIDSSRQIEIVESMINRGVAGISLAPVDRRALIAVVERAQSRNIPVAIFDSAIDTSDILFFVATDNKESGRLAARRMAEICHDEGKVGVIGFGPGSASTTDRESGFTEEIATRHPKMKVVSVLFSMADRAKAMSNAENIMAANPDLAGLFADNESSSAGAVQALKARGSKKIKLVAYDASEQLLDDMKAGWIDSIVVQNPWKMGYESVHAITTKLSNQSLPTKTLDSGAVLVTPQNMDTPDMKTLLHPDIQQYLQ